MAKQKDSLSTMIERLFEELKKREALQNETGISEDTLECFSEAGIIARDDSAEILVKKIQAATEQIAARNCGAIVNYERFLSKIRWISGFVLVPLYAIALELLGKHGIIPVVQKDQPTPLPVLLTYSLTAFSFVLMIYFCSWLGDSLAPSQARKLLDEHSEYRGWGEERVISQLRAGGELLDLFGWLVFLLTYVVGFKYLGLFAESTGLVTVALLVLIYAVGYPLGYVSLFPYVKKRLRRQASS